ncbi:leucine-rich repeat protein [Tanacetum coccineum]
MGFVNGTCVRSSYLASALLLEHRDRCNGVVLNWILSSLSQDPIRSSLLTKEVLSEVKDAFVILAREESHRGIPATTAKSDKPQASVFVSRVNDVKRSNSNANWNNGNTSNNNRGNYNSLLCKNCGLKGHTIERCFEIIGYPPGFKRNPNLKVNGTFNNNKSNNADLKRKSVETNDLKTTAGTLSFTHEQVVKLMNLLNDKSGSTAHANMAAKITHIGNLRLNNNVILFDVLVIPEYCDLKMETVLGTGSESTGLYLFNVDCDKIVVSNQSKYFVCYVSKDVWHNRLRHPANQRTTGGGSDSDMFSLEFNYESTTANDASLGPRFPSWVQSQTMLTDLDLSNANISGIIPNWIWTTFSAVTYLNISHNNIQGKLGDVSFVTPGAVLDLSANHFNGLLPSNFSKLNLDFLDLSYNNISGSLGQYLCSEIQEPRLLRVLNLGNNNMSGVIPDCWINWESLIILNLEKNRFSGIIPPSLGNISSLASLDMRNNRLFGSLPVSLLNSKSLIILELAENGLTGEIPASIGRESTSLKLLSLRSNKLDGNIPVEICRLSSIQILDLAHNDLSGNLPKCFKNFSVIAGREFLTIFYFRIKFLAAHRCELVELSGLRYLNLSQNDLTGSIPNTFREMRQLESLDLSFNHLDGKIPSSLSSLSGLNFLNVSYNNLSGRIPTAGFKRRKPLPGTISFTNQVQEFELSQYILNTGYKQNESFSEASSSTQQVQ